MEKQAEEGCYFKPQLIPNKLNMMHNSQGNYIPVQDYKVRVDHRKKIILYQQKRKEQEEMEDVRDIPKIDKK